MSNEAGFRKIKEAIDEYHEGMTLKHLEELLREGGLTEAHISWDTIRHRYRFGAVYGFNDVRVGYGRTIVEAAKNMVDSLG